MFDFSKISTTPLQTMIISNVFYFEIMTIFQKCSILWSTFRDHKLNEEAEKRVKVSANEYRSEFDLKLSVQLLKHNYFIDLGC